MKQILLLLAYVTAIPTASLLAAPKKMKNPVVERTSAITPIYEFQADDISVALRSIARGAELNMVVSDQVVGTVTMKIENRTPREAIAIIASVKELIVDEVKGVLYVRPKNPPPPTPPKTPEPEKPISEALSEMITPAVTKLMDSILDYQGRPETAQKIAKTKKALYEALIAEGFKAEEAFRIILTNQELSLPGPK